MIRTTRGQKFLDMIARPRTLWKVFADIGIPLMLIGMFLMFLLIIFSDILYFSSLQRQTMPPPTELHELRNIFLIPGINEFIPVVWGIIGLIVTLVVHEFSHAILCKVEDIRVKSMGLILVLVPIGGFAEPDEEQLFGKSANGGETNKVQQPANRRKRVRILAAGVMANFVTALVAFVLFFIVIGNIAPVSDVMITDVVAGSPAADAGLTKSTIITHVNGIKIENASSFYANVDAVPVNETITLRIKNDGNSGDVTLTPYPDISGTVSAVKFEKIIPGMPSEAAGLVDGMIIFSINGTPMLNTHVFSEYMLNTTAGQEITLQTLFGDEQINYSITLAKDPGGTDKGFIGITGFSTVVIASSIGISVGEYPAKDLLHFLQMIPALMTVPAGWFVLLSLPFPNPFIGSFQGFGNSLYVFYEPIGWAAPLGVGVFWLANTLLWVGWLNFYVGLFNCLPMLPLDGGHVFRDTVHSVLEKLFGNEERMGVIAGKIATGFAFLILASLVFLIFAPYIAQI